MVDITNEWTTKRVSPVRFQDTHNHLFSDEVNLTKQKIQHYKERLRNLKKNDAREKSYNIINLSTDSAANEL